MVTTVYLIRHGLTVGGEEKRYKGYLDIALSEEGTGQIERLAGHLKTRVDGASRKGLVGFGGLDAVYCSDLSRARKSAEIIAETFGLTPVVRHEIRERSFGKWEGMSFNEIRAGYPEAFESWAANPLEFSPVGGESTLDVRERAMPVFFEMMGNHRGRSIAIIAHGGINRIILCELLGIPLKHIFRIEQDFAALNIIEFYDETPVVKIMNYTV